MSLAYIALGSNLGNTKENLHNALKYMKQSKLIVKKISSFIETSPYGVLDQPNFLNAVCLIETTVSPQELLVLLNSIENKMGRVRTSHWGQRIIDLDILLYDDVIVNEENLQIPHIDMLNRSFVLTPLVEIAGEDFIYPISGIKIKDYLDRL